MHFDEAKFDERTSVCQSQHRGEGYSKLISRVTDIKRLTSLRDTRSYSADESLSFTVVLHSLLSPISETERVSGYAVSGHLEASPHTVTELASLPF